MNFHLIPVKNINWTSFFSDDIQERKAPSNTVPHHLSNKSMSKWKKGRQKQQRTYKLSINNKIRLMCKFWKCSKYRHIFHVRKQYHNSLVTKVDGAKVFMKCIRWVIAHICACIDHRRHGCRAVLMSGRAYIYQLEMNSNIDIVEMSPSIHLRISFWLIELQTIRKSVLW